MDSYLINFIKNDKKYTPEEKEMYIKIIKGEYFELKPEMKLKQKTRNDKTG